MVAPEFEEGALGIADGALESGADVGDFDGPVTASEGGDGIVVGSGGGEFVSGAIVEMKLQLALSRIGNYNRTLRKSNVGGAVGGSFGEKNTIPVSAAGRDVVDVKDEMGEVLVEDARLDSERDLGSKE